MSWVPSLHALLSITLEVCSPLSDVDPNLESDMSPDAVELQRVALNGIFHKDPVIKVFTV